MTNPDIAVFPVYEMGAFFIVIDGREAHVPFVEVTPHVAELLELLDRAAIEEDRTDEHE